MRSPSSLSRIEKGLHHVPVRDLEYILGKYAVTDPAVRDRLFDWCRNGRKKGWWQRYATDLSPEMMDFIGLEADASKIDFFELMLIPGLLQTENYARSLIQTGPFAHDPQQVDRLLAIRMKRQDILMHPRSPVIRVVLDEAVLRRQVGGPQVMREQFQRLLDVTRSPNVALQVIPFSTGAHWGVTGAFTIMTIDHPGELRIVTVDSLSTISYREEDPDLDTYTTAFEELRSMALPAADSHAVIRRLLSST